MAAPSPLVASLSDRENYSIWNIDRLRSTDIDYQGHVNNTIFPVFFTSGRHDFLQVRLRPHVAPDDMYALVKITIEYLKEMRHPGDVEIGTRVRAVSRSSFSLGQALFNNNQCVAVAESIVVLLDPVTRRAKPWPAAASGFLAGMVASASAASR
jgi:acyl-CoA thioester hydrolase